MNPSPRSTLEERRPLRGPVFELLSFSPFLISPRVLELRINLERREGEKFAGVLLTRPPTAFWRDQPASALAPCLSEYVDPRKGKGGAWDVLSYCSGLA